MSYEEEEQRRSRVVVETPNERREVYHQQTVRAPERREGFSAGMVAAVALAAIAATAIIFLFLMNRGDDSTTNVNVRTGTQPTPAVAQQPVVAPQPVTTQPTPIVITQPAPIVVTQPAPVETTTTTTTAPPPASAPPASSGSDDMAVQTRLDDAFRKDAEIFESGVTGIVVEGKATLTGAVKTDAIKAKAERLAYAVRGVRSVENRIIVVASP
ncbi:MAG TPA: BON domain-containing protein [Pyrinomonadaceae bacterium]|nr:BON domain-containing protein [Pyrinomonadaceae bacterium]